MNAFSRFIAGLLICFTTYFIINLVIYFTSKEKHKKEFDTAHWIVKGPKIISLLYCFFSLVFLCLVVLSHKQYSTEGGAIWPCIVFIIFFLICFCLNISVSLWKIELFKDNDWFIYRPLIKKHKIYYNECKLLNYHNGSVFLKTKAKKIGIPSFLINREILMLMLHENDVPEIMEELQDRIVVRMKKAATGIFIVLTIINLVLSVVCYFYDKADNSVVIFCAISTFCLMLVTLYYMLFKVEILKGKDYFVYRAPFFKATKIYYNDCQHYLRGKVFLILKTNSKRLYIRVTAENYDLFFQDLSRHKIPRVNKYNSL